MSKVNNAFCPNKDCKDYGLRNYGNITFRGKYGKDKKRDLLNYFLNFSVSRSGN